jgi:hypothetical protein
MVILAHIKFPAITEVQMKLSRTVLAIVIGSLLCGCSHTGGQWPARALGRITPEDVHRNIFYLASDTMKGRNTPSPELDTAAAYIAREFALDGLRPVNGSYFQRVLLNIVGLGEPNALRVRSGSAEKSYEIKTDFSPFEMTSNGSVRGPVVFAGYGITAPQYHYDDYAGIDVKGKIVFLLRHEPGEEDSTSVFLGTAPTEYSSVETKVRIAMEHGAVGVMVATDPLNHSSLAPRGFPWPSLSHFIPKDALPLALGQEESGKVPVMHVGEGVIAQLFGSVDSLRALQRKIDERLVPHSYSIAGAEAFLQTSTEIREMSASNVVGMLPGNDPALKSETVIVGAHYDHVGYMKQHAPGARYIFNGADDNASGTCALLEIAAALGGLPSSPRRTILCIAFAGEEKGLFGSEYYARHPLFPLKSTVAMLNMDMVGMNGVDTLFLIGSEGSPDIARIAREEDARVGFVLLDQKEPMGTGSDHMTFMKRNIPDLFFHSGLESVYHTVNDRPELIDTRKVARAASLVFLTAYHIANDSLHYRYIPFNSSIF